MLCGVPDPTDPVLDFDAAWRLASGVDGWLTEAQARTLYDAARVAAPGRVVEIGSHLGRSTIMLAASGAAVTAIDPFPANWRYGRPDTEERLHRHLAEAGVASQVHVRVATSRVARAGWVEPVRLLYVDGKHDMRSCLDDLRWSRFLRAGDILMVHDAFSSLGVTLALLLDAATTDRHRYVGRTGSLARFEIARPSPSDRLRVLREMPWFVRNLVVKVLLRLRLHLLTRALGHRGTADPY